MQSFLTKLAGTFVQIWNIKSAVACRLYSELKYSDASDQHLVHGNIYFTTDNIPYTMYLPFIIIHKDHTIFIGI